MTSSRKYAEIAAAALGKVLPPSTDSKDIADIAESILAEASLTDVELAVIGGILRSHNNEWLFPANSESGHIEEPRPEASDGFTVPFTVHSLRHTYISAATAAGVSPYHTKLLTNHSVPKGDVTGGYVRADVDALRPSQETIVEFFRGHGLKL